MKLTDRLRPNRLTLRILSYSQTAQLASRYTTATSDSVEFEILLFIYQILSLKRTTGAGKLGHYSFEGKTALV